MKDTRPYLSLQWGTSLLASQSAACSSPSPCSLNDHWLISPGQNTPCGLWLGDQVPFWSVVGLAQPLPHSLAEQALQSLRSEAAGPLGQMGPHALKETSGWLWPGGWMNRTNSVSVVYASGSLGPRVCLRSEREAVTGGPLSPVFY